MHSEQSMGGLSLDVVNLASVAIEALPIALIDDELCVGLEKRPLADESARASLFRSEVSEGELIGEAVQRLAEQINRSSFTHTVRRVSLLSTGIASPRAAVDRHDPIWPEGRVLRRTSQAPYQPSLTLRLLMLMMPKSRPDGDKAHAHDGTDIAWFNARETIEAGDFRRPDGLSSVDLAVVQHATTQIMHRYRYVAPCFLPWQFSIKDLMTVTRATQLGGLSTPVSSFYRKATELLEREDGDDAFGTTNPVPLFDRLIKRPMAGVADDHVEDRRPFTKLGQSFEAIAEYETPNSFVSDEIESAAGKFEDLSVAHALNSCVFIPEPSALYGQPIEALSRYRQSFVYCHQDLDRTWWDEEFNDNKRGVYGYEIAYSRAFDLVEFIPRRSADASGSTSSGDWTILTRKAAFDASHGPKFLSLVRIQMLPEEFYRSAFIGADSYAAPFALALMGPYRNRGFSVPPGRLGREDLLLAAMTPNMPKYLVDDTPSEVPAPRWPDLYPEHVGSIPINVNHEAWSRQLTLWRRW